LVISYDFQEDEELARPCNEKDKNNLKNIFCGSQNEIDFVSLSAKEVPECLSSEKYSKNFQDCKYCYKTANLTVLMSCPNIL